MSKRCTTPSFVLEVPRVITPDDERVLLARLEAGRRLYNAVLGDALQRLAAMRADAAWAAACALPKGDGGANGGVSCLPRTPWVQRKRPSGLRHGPQERGRISGSAGCP